MQAYLEDNKVPIPFLVMLILQFGLIIIDRALFLRKFILGKILFQICLIIGVHIWMFFILPAVTERLNFFQLSIYYTYFQSIKSSFNSFQEFQCPSSTTNVVYGEMYLSIVLSISNKMWISYTNSWKLFVQRIQLCQYVLI